MAATVGQMRRLVVCVDDFGLHDGVNQAVLALLGLGRVSATSCLVDGPAWAAGAPALREATGHAQGAPRADVGLHLNFTEAFGPAVPRALPTQGLAPLLRAAYLRQLDQAAVVREVQRQWDRFEAVWGAPPDFIDGHQHVHQLPQIRDALVQVLAQRCATMGEGARPWVRRCVSPGWRALVAGISLTDTLKAGVIGVLGARALSREVARLGVRHSGRLLGVYPFDADAAAYMRRWQAWLRLAGPAGDLLMCHPAAPLPMPGAQDDVIAAARHMEHAVLTSPAFGQLLQASGVQVTRLARALAA